MPARTLFAATKSTGRAASESQAVEGLWVPYLHFKPEVTLEELALVIAHAETKCKDGTGFHAEACQAATARWKEVLLKAVGTGELMVEPPSVAPCTTVDRVVKQAQFRAYLVNQGLITQECRPGVLVDLGEEPDWVRSIAPKLLELLPSDRVRGKRVFHPRRTCDFVCSVAEYLSPLHHGSLRQRMDVQRLGYFTVEDTAAILSKKPDGPSYENIEEQLHRARLPDGRRLARDDDQLPLNGETVLASYRALVQAEEVNQWLAHLKCPYRFEPGLVMQAETSKATVKKPGKQLAPQAIDAETKPWLVPHPGDPESDLQWYTAARYFARQLAMADQSLLKKRNLLAAKVCTKLWTAGVKKEHGRGRFAPGTILKAFSNVNFS
jgi:hypothetical protein